MRLTFAAVVAAALAACYDPEVHDCTITCGAGGHCATGQVCGADGWCASSETAGHCDGVRDARMAIDATPRPDARADLCALGCTNGTCDGDGMCVIDCGGDGACAMDVHCPVNLPCRVVCGAHACAGHVDCTKATSCDVECTGQNACASEVDCGAGRCDVTCSGDGSCHGKIKCHPSCACDATCTGDMSCGGGAECPQDGTTCHLGLGCTSQLAGCDACS